MPGLNRHPGASTVPDAESGWRALAAGVPGRVCRSEEFSARPPGERGESRVGQWPRWAGRRLAWGPAWAARRFPTLVLSRSRGPARPAARPAARRPFKPGSALRARPTPTGPEPAPPVCGPEASAPLLRSRRWVQSPARCCGLGLSFAGVVGKRRHQSLAQLVLEVVLPSWSFYSLSGFQPQVADPRGERRPGAERLWGLRRRADAFVVADLFS